MIVQPLAALDHFSSSEPFPGRFGCPYRTEVYRLKLRNQKAKRLTKLILNADDLGLTAGVNQSILDLNRAGALTSATLMATADHMAAAAAAAARQFSLGVGCHVILVDGKPVLPQSSIPALAVSPGAFRSTLGAFVFDLMRGRIPEAEIELEVIAQIRHLQATGLRVTHLDTHKHTHIFPRVLRPLLRAALLCGIRAIRNPFEPDWALDATPRAPALRRMEVRLLRTQRREFVRCVEQAGAVTTDGAIGVLATGTLNAEALESLLAAMPDGTWELVCHPGYCDEDLNRVQTRLRESRAIEHAALAQTVPRYLARHPGIARINFGQIQEIAA
jgi:chitin disaccharide deacetylase